MAEPLYQNPPSVAFVHLPGHPLAGKLTREAWLFLQQVMQRIGGSVALTPEELAIIVEQVQAGAADVTLQPTPPDAEAVALPPHWHALPPPSPPWWPEVSPEVPPAAPWWPEVLPPPVTQRPSPSWWAQAPSPTPRPSARAAWLSWPAAT
jgi:hypothetical protein